MAKKPALEAHQTKELITTTIALLEDSMIFSSIRKNLLEDLKRLCVDSKEYKKLFPATYGVRLIKKPGSFIPECHIFAGTYVAIALGQYGLNLGFIADKVADALMKQFEGTCTKTYSEGPYLLSGSNMNRYYKTSKGTFMLSYTDTLGWLIARRR